MTIPEHAALVAAALERTAADDLNDDEVWEDREGDDEPPHPFLNIGEGEYGIGEER